MMITGGGTGGHLYPALAVAEAVRMRRPGLNLLFIGLDAVQDRQEVERRGFAFMGLPLLGWRRRFSMRNAKALLLFVWGIFRCVKQWRRFQPGVVFGVGGYVSAPAMIAGRWLKWKVALHEQNTVPGLVNRMLARGCDRVFITFEQTRRRLPGRTCECTGFPLRREVIQPAPHRPKEKREPDVGGNLLLIGGSQGARRLVETACGTFVEWNRRALPFKARVQTGEKNLEWARQLPWPEGIELVPFIHDMAAAYAEADLMISRAGAGSLAEIALWGLPAVLIPYPYSSENHQAVNAEEWQAAGAAVVIPESQLTPAGLGDVLEDLLTHPDRREEMSRKALGLARRDAADVLADRLIQMLEAAA